MPLSDLAAIERLSFLKTAGWSGVTLETIGGDWSQRSFFRVRKDEVTAILMHAVPDDDPRAIPGHKLRDFIKISAYLRKLNLSAPEVYAQDLPRGFLLVEDFGTQDFSSLLTFGAEREQDAYLLATRTLARLYEASEAVKPDCPDYYAGHVHKGRQRVVDWYMPALLNRTNPDGFTEDYLAVWAGIESKLPPVQRRFLHGDFHPGNLMWLPERQGIAQTGLIDFQGAMVGPAPYDLVNLLDDARREVPDDLRLECLARFTKTLSPADKDAFLLWYPVLATQFHCRVIGQALRLAIRDGKERLLTVIPTLRRHLVRDLSHPVLAPLKHWFDAQGVDFTNTRLIDVKETAKFIRPDAF